MTTGTDPFDVFFRPPDDGEPVVLKALSVRLPQRTFRYVEEMAEHANLSRNAMAVQLLEWGISFALARLPDEIRDEIGMAVDGPDFPHLYHQGEL